MAGDLQLTELRVQVASTALEETPTYSSELGANQPTLGLSQTLGVPPLYVELVDTSIKLLSSTSSLTFTELASIEGSTILTADNTIVFTQLAEAVDAFTMTAGSSITLSQLSTLEFVQAGTIPVTNIADDLINYAITFDTSGSDTRSRTLLREVENYVQSDPYGRGLLGARSGVYTITGGDATGGTFDLNFTMFDGTTFSVTGIDYNILKSTLQTAIDNAAGIALSGYVDGLIGVSGANQLTDGVDISISISGTQYQGHHTIELDPTNLTGGTDHTIVETTIGHVNRFWFAALKAFGVLKGSDPAWGEAPAGQYTVNLRDELENYPSNESIKMLIEEASVQEEQDWEAELFPLLGFSPRSRLSEDY